jgi:hypothetical protein
VVSQKITRVGITHGEEGLKELEVGCQNESEVRHHATDHDEDLDDSGLFEEMNHYSHQMC